MNIRNIAIAGMVTLIAAACAPSGDTLRDGSEEAHPLALELECNGTEPFWMLSLTPGRGEYHPMDGEDRTFTLSPPRRAAGRTDLWTLQGYDDATDRPVVITLRRTGQCSDGMSDFDYDYEIILAPEGRQPLAGCCGRQQQLPARNPE